MTRCEGRITYTIPALGVVVVPGPGPGDVVIHRVDRPRLAVLLLLLVAHALVATLAGATGRRRRPVPAGASMALERWSRAGVAEVLHRMDAAVCQGDLRRPPVAGRGPAGASSRATHSPPMTRRRITPACGTASTHRHVAAQPDATPLPPPDEPQVVCCGHEVGGLVAGGSGNPAPRYLARRAGDGGGPARLVPRRGRLFYLGVAVQEGRVAHHYALSGPAVLLTVVVASPDGGPDTARVIPWRLLPDPLARTLDGILMRERDRD